MVSCFGEKISDVGLAGLKLILCSILLYYTILFTIYTLKLDYMYVVSQSSLGSTT